jgi:hypothetical protein
MVICAPNGIEPDVRPMTIHIEIHVERGGFPSSDELRLRQELEDWIHDNRIGEVVDAGSGGGVMDIYVKSIDESAQDLIERQIAQRGLVRVASVRTIE